MYYVYIMTDPTNNTPFYIGKGSGNRMMVHEKVYHTLRERKANPLKTARIKAIKDAGLCILYKQIDCSSETEALNLERKLIALYGRLNAGDGILTNLAEGGAGGKPALPIHQYDKTGRFVGTFQAVKEAAASFGIVVSSIQNAANSTHPQKSAAGFLWSYEKVDQLPMWNHTLHTPVVQYDKQSNKIAEYPTIAVASATTGIDAGNISACTDRKLKTAGGFVWRNQSDPFSLEMHKACKTVQQLDKQTDEVIAVYQSVKEAARQTGIESTNISRCCNGRLKSAGKFGWRYA